MESGWVQGDGLRLWVTRQGDPGAPAVLLVHGYPDNSSMWDGVAERLVGRFHVVRYDVRGTGRSEAPADRSGYRLDHLAADLAAVARVTGPVHLVGHDWGSVQSWHAVTDPRYAGLFASFTSISGPCLDHVDAWLRRNVRRLRVGRVLRQLTHSWYIGFFRLPGLPELAWRTSLLRSRFAADRRDAVNGLELYRANMGQARAERRTDVPVQQLALTRDPFVLPPLLAAADPWCSRLYRRALPLGHWAPRTHPDTVAARVTEFVDQTAAATESRPFRRARVGSGRRFEGHLVVVTGAGSGIGRAAAVAFAEAGAEVVATDVNPDTAAATARDVGGHSYPLDVSDSAAVRRVAAEIVAAHGVPDVVLANAGIGLAGGFLDTSEADWRRVIDVNLLGVVHTLRAFAPALVDRAAGGHLVITASAAAFTPWPSLTAYAATKAALVSLAQSMRTELAPHGVGVTAICPGLVATNIINTTRFAGQDEAEERASRASVDALYRRRDYRPERVAAAILTAVADNRAVVPVTPEAHLAAVGARLSPAAVRLFGASRRPGAGPSR